MTNKGRMFPGEPLTSAEVAVLMRGCSLRAPTGVRNRALITVMYRCGLRISEVLALKASDIDSDAGTIRVLRGKDNKSRVVGIDETTLLAVQRWADMRRARGIRNGRLFCTLPGTPLSDRYTRELMSRLGRKAGIEKRTHAHGLRHTNATEFGRGGASQRDLEAPGALVHRDHREIPEPSGIASDGRVCAGRLLSGGPQLPCAPG